MQSAVEADLQQLELLFAIHRRFDPAIDTTEIAKEIGARLREELDYVREAKHVALYRDMLQGQRRRSACRRSGRSSRPAGCSRSTGSTAASCSTHKDDAARRAQPARHRHVHRLVVSVQPLRRHPRRSASRQLHGVRRRDGKPAGINLLDYGCIRIFPPSFVGGVVDLYHGLLHGDDDLVVHAYETWGFKRLNRELIDALNIWARFIYGPLLDDRVRTIADGVKPSEYGRREAFRVHQALKEQGPGHGAARIRVHGPRRHRARRGVPASGARS